MVYQNRPFVERIDRAVELGVEAVEFWEWSNKNLDAVTAAIGEHGLDLVGGGTEDHDLTDPDQHDRAVTEIEDSVATAREIGCPNCSVLSGQAQADVDHASQHESVVRVLREVVQTAEAPDVTLLLDHAPTRTVQRRRRPSPRPSTTPATRDTSATHSFRRAIRTT